MHISLKIFTASIGILLIGGLANFTFHALGYQTIYSMYDTEEYAKLLYAENRSATDCMKIHTFFPTYPPLYEFRWGCVRKYAEITNDTSVCKLLLPDEFGLSCVGNIWGKYIDAKNCHWYKDNSVRCFEGKDLTPHVYDCSEKNIGSSPDECIHRLAFKKKDTNVCLKIKDVTLRSVCTTRIDTWNKYPELRSTIFFNDDIK